MKNKWSKSEAEKIIAQFSMTFGQSLAECVYISRLIGEEPDLVMHGGGNTSVKTEVQNVFGELQPTLFVKGSGFDLANIQPQNFAVMDLDRARKLRAVADLSQEEMGRQLRILLSEPDSPIPSVEAFMHAFIPSKFVVHTHPAAILGLTNQPAPTAALQSGLGDNIASVPYLRAGFGLAQAAATAFRSNAAGMVLQQHGLVTWGETAEEAYEATIRLVSQAQDYWKKKASGRHPVASETDVNRAWERYTELVPVIRGLLAEPTTNADQPFRRVIVLPLISPQALGLLNSPQGQSLAISEPLTPDHLVRTKATPLLIQLNSHDLEKTKLDMRAALQTYVQGYEEYFQRYSQRLPPGARKLDSMPRILMIPEVGVLCAGVNAKAATVARDITEQALRVKGWFAQSGTEYLGIGEEHLFDMEHLLMQQAKIEMKEAPLQRQVAIVTGAAGAIGTGITEALLQNGCHVALTDLHAEHLEKAAKAFTDRYPHQVMSACMDVADAESVKNGFNQVIRTWGGVDLVIINAGIAMVSSLAEMDLERFRALERVNVEGTLLVLREAASIFRIQGTGGDVVMISTKNVFAPGAKFGAYSATKAAAHQLARIASLELAELNVRVNMVSPDAVFSHGQTRSGLWSEVGPDRMKARGLDEAGLEEYYKNRNLLKATITAEHVARAVLFFATRQTPTTGATLPVDGGLPDSTPR